MGVLLINIHNELQVFLAEYLNNTSGGLSILNVCFIFIAAALYLILFQF